jgi:putative ABC transport system substrate-binding protein
MTRREFILTVCGAAAWPLAARAQQAHTVRRIGFLTGLAENDQDSQTGLTAFRQELERLGWVEGRNVLIYYRWANGDPIRARTHAKELIALSPDVVLVNATMAMRALLEATRTIPTIFVSVSDPAFVENLARPSGNTTGFTNFESSMGGKWLEVLKEMVPRTGQATAIYNPTTSPHIAAGRYLLPLEDSAGRLVIRMTNSPVHSSTEVEQVIARVADAGDGGLVVLPDTFTSNYANLIISWTAKYRLPAIYPYESMVRSGGLVSYGINPTEQYLGAAGYVDRILRGATIAYLPVQAPAKFHLAVNLKTAKTLGLTVPPSLLARADEVIE